MMSEKPITAQDVRKAGWEPEEAGITFMEYRATQGPFSTPWLKSWAEVLGWIKGKKDLLK